MHPSALTQLVLGAAMLGYGCVGNVVESDDQVTAILPGQPDGSLLNPVPVPVFDGGFTGVDAGEIPITPVPVVDGGPNPGTDSGIIVTPGNDAGTQPGPQNPCGTGNEPIVTDLRLREISLYQTVKVPLYKDGAWVATRNASVVQGKKSLVRVFVEPLTGYSPRALRAVLTLDNGGTPTTLTSEKTLTAASTDEAAGSTFDFAVEGSALGGSTKLSVAIMEPSCPAQRPTGTAARFPASGTQDLGAGAIGKLRVVAVPVTLSGRTPDVGAAQIKAIRDELLAYYPVGEVEVTAHAPVSWTSAVGADGSGWSELLNQIGRLRQSESAARDVYYFGLITPAATFRDYCRTSCVLGLAPQTTRVSSPDQIGLGIGFVDANTYDTVVHELGHAHGLPHAPCVPRGGSIAGADTRYPYAGAKIGSWGWDSRNSALLAPSAFVDVMSYCDPTWISDYNYEKLATRARAVNIASAIGGFDKGAPQSWERVIWSASGQARWAGITSHETPGDPTAAQAIGPDGSVVAEVSVVVVPLSHTADSFLYLPALEASWTALRIGERLLDLQDIAPAL